jgi:hypothetical protein
VELPISPNDLNEVVYNIARDVLEERAIEGDVEEFSEEETNKVLDEVIYVIERYMYYINSLMDNAKLEQSKKIFEKPGNF